MSWHRTKEVLPEEKQLVWIYYQDIEDGDFVYDAGALVDSKWCDQWFRELEDVKVIFWAEIEKTPSLARLTIPYFPGSCEKCRFCISYDRDGRYSCLASYEHCFKDIEDTRIRQYWCPLEEVNVE